MTRFASDHDLTLTENGLVRLDLEDVFLRLDRLEGACSMTAIAIADAKRAASPPPSGRFLGLRPLLRKDRTEWMRGRGAWIVAVADDPVHGPDRGQRRRSPPTSAPTSRSPAGRHPDAVAGSRHEPAGARSRSQIFVVAAVFAVASLIVHERETGTLAWVASKPVSRGSIWLSKWISSTAILAVAAALVPLVVTTGVVVALYGSVPLRSSPLVARRDDRGHRVLRGDRPGGRVGPAGSPRSWRSGWASCSWSRSSPDSCRSTSAPYLPTSILDWTVGLAAGQDVGVITPIAWAIGTVAIIAFAIRRMERIEL